MSRNVGELQSIQGRFRVARAAVEAVGAALMFLRGKDTSCWQSFGGQLKTSADRAAEGWIVEYILSFYPTDSILAEESFEEKGGVWDAPSAFWTVDALDGTRSFVEGFDGFCVQVAYVEAGQVKLGVVHEPVRHASYWALEGQGAFRQTEHGECQRLQVQLLTGWPPRPVFIDSTRPNGPVGRLMANHSGQFSECGSIGLKICRVADGTAHVFAKALTFKLWDTAPGDLILQEAGGRLGRWSGERVPYGGRQVYFENLLAASRTLFDLAVLELSRPSQRKGGLGR